MPTSKELTIRVEDRPGTLARCCKTLADHNVNILAFQSVPAEGKGLVRMVVDNPANAKKALDRDSNIAAATSTGGTLNKAPGRLGDSSLIGCGCYADNRTAAASTTPRYGRPSNATNWYFM